MPRTWRDRPWVVATAPPLEVALVSPRHPDHQSPAPDLAVGTPSWVADTLVPTLPDEMVGDQFLQLPVPGGPLDMEPDSHAYGVGAGPGLSREASQAAMGRWHTEDLGSVQARRYAPQAARDGAWHVDVIPDGDASASPSTVSLRHETGVGAPNDPHARRGYRIWRWRERFIDRHMWGVAKRPVYLRNAYSDPGQAAVSLGPTVTPAPSPAAWGRHGIGSPDRWVVPQERRVPRSWDETARTDGTVGQPEQALPSWGL